WAAGRRNANLSPEEARGAERPPAAVELCYVGEAGGVEEGLAARAGIPFRAIATGQVRGQAPWTAAASLWRMRRGAGQCRAILADFRPEVVFLTGGYVAAPVAWAAWRMGIPILIYLPDVTPGQAIRLTARLATRVAVSFPEVARYFGKKAVVTGYPVRRELLMADRAAARAALGLTADLPVLLVMGGSRGARSINRALIAGLRTLLERCQVVHVSGPLDWPEVEKAAAGLPASVADRYHPYPYLHEMPLALAAADLAVARAGAATLGEFPAVGLPAVLVPYPYSGQHQEANAAYLADRGAALVIKDSELTDRLTETVLGLLAAPPRLAAMAQAARALARPDAAANIAAQLRELAEKCARPTR
ncbi:MAG: UDP-N-acetylglucosamine--N-acetylmuramyl-(pentapeptide) pyrophosphoryl-undecaprenol N-acetylglucosamine transferase, partial [Anaerolineae bacterium]